MHSFRFLVFVHVTRDLPFLEILSQLLYLVRNDGIRMQHQLHRVVHVLVVSHPRLSERNPVQLITVLVQPFRFQSLVVLEVFV